MGTLIRVGEEFTLFKEKIPHYKAAYTDGSYFEALEENDGFVMATYLTDMSHEERNLLKIGTIHARIIKENQKILAILRFGHSPLMFEISFDPTLYQDKRPLQIAFYNHMVTFISIERRTNIIQTIRVANMPMRLKQAFITSWDNAYNNPNFSEEYTEWVDSLMSFSTIELWNKGESVGTFGEKGVFEE